MIAPMPLELADEPIAERGRTGRSCLRWWPARLIGQTADAVPPRVAAGLVMEAAFIASQARPRPGRPGPLDARRPAPAACRSPATTASAGDRVTRLPPASHGRHERARRQCRTLDRARRDHSPRLQLSEDPSGSFPCLPWPMTEPGVRSGVASPPTARVAASSAAVRPLTGWRQAGAISARGPMTKRRSWARGCGRIRPGPARSPARP